MNIILVARPEVGRQGMTRLGEREARRKVNWNSGCWRQVALFGIITITSPLPTQAHQPGWKWAASWTTAPQDVFPGSSTPALVNFAFPNPTVGANNQTLRMIIKPDLWSNKIRLRFSNYWDTQPVTLGHVMVGLQAYSGNLVASTNTEVTFGGKQSVTIPPGEEIFSDAVLLKWVVVEELIFALGVVGAVMVASIVVSVIAAVGDGRITG
jgi:hypothetical protein